MKIYDFLANGNTIEIQYGKHLIIYVTVSNGALRWAKNTDTLSGLLINLRQERQDKLNKTFTDVYPDGFIIGNVIVCLYDVHNKCLLHNKTLDEAEDFIKNYNPNQKKEDNSMTINNFLSNGGQILCTWNANIKCRKTVTINDFDVADNITLGDLTNFLWQDSHFESNGTSSSIKLQNKQYTLIDAGGNILIEKVGKSEAADFLKRYTPKLFEFEHNRFIKYGQNDLAKIIDNLNDEFGHDPEKRKLILNAYKAGTKLKGNSDETVFYDLRAITERYNKITAENSITTQDEQRKVLSNIVDFYCDII